MEHYYQKETQKKKKTRFFFKTYKPLKGVSIKSDKITDEVFQMMNDKKQLNDDQLFNELAKRMIDIINLCLDGLNYFQKYDRTMLLSITITAYVSFFIFILTFELKY